MKYNFEEYRIQSNDKCSRVICRDLSGKPGYEIFLAIPPLIERKSSALKQDISSYLKKAYGKIFCEVEEIRTNMFTGYRLITALDYILDEDEIFTIISNIKHKLSRHRINEKSLENLMEEFEKHLLERDKHSTREEILDDQINYLTKTKSTQNNQSKQQNQHKISNDKIEFMFTYLEQYAELAFKRSNSDTAKKMKDYTNQIQELSDEVNKLICKRNQ